MNAERLLQHFERISEAPDAIPRLRRFILDLAVRSKLVGQDPNDEPAAELLNRIEEGKTCLAKVRAIRELRAARPSNDDEDLYLLPANWKWCRLSQVGAIVGGGTPPSGDLENFTDGGAGIAWLTPADLGKFRGLYINHGTRDLTDKGLRVSSATLMPKGSVLFTSRAPIGYTAIAANEISTNQGFKSIVPYIWDFSRYIAIYFRAFAPWIDGKASGTTFHEVSGKIVANLPFPLPPLSEQHRIVAKVDELMALCDQLEAVKASREQSRDRLVAASLHRLNQSNDKTESDSAGSFRENALFLFNHLPLLTTRLEYIKQLRQTILSLAVRGKLVAQDPKDEPALELLKQIKAEESLEKPFSIPLSWAWVSVGQMGDARLGKMLDKVKNKGTPRRYLRNVNVRWFDFDLTDVLEMRFEDIEINEFSIHRGDVLICEGGEPGRAAVWDAREEKIYFQKAIHRVRFSKGVDPYFFVYAIRESADGGRLLTYFTGVGIKHFTGKGLSSFVFPLPPLAEQHRIVAKVDELMALCDQLEVHLTTCESDSSRLLETVLHEALAPTLEKTV